MTSRPDFSLPPSSLELLAPAGTLPAFEAALHEGADAVYIGAPEFNARALARDFSLAEIAAMAISAREQGKKLYVAMNSLVKESEVPAALRMLAALEGIGPDALIVQDFGIVHLVKRFFPGLSLHASTLMTVNNSLGANFLAGMGFKRVVLARELRIEEMLAIREQSNIALEIFIHGALCFSYSGLCRFSSLHGGKSSLRGQCVQPCRRRYDWLPSGKKKAAVTSTGKGGGYLFSMNDLCGFEHLTAIRAAGVNSLKIEGRLKSVEYVRHAVRGYRLALNALDAEPEEGRNMMIAARQALDRALGRKQATGFLVAGQEDNLIVPRLSGSTGEVVGKITRVEDKGRYGKLATVALRVQLQRAVALGDRLRLYNQRTGDRKSFTLRDMEIHGKKIVQARPGQTVIMVPAGAITDNPRTLEHGVLFRVDIGGGETCSKDLQRRVSSSRPPEIVPAVLEPMLAALAIAQERPSSIASKRSGTRKKTTGAKARAGRPQWWVRLANLSGIGYRFPFDVAALIIELNAETLAQYRPGQRHRYPPLIWALPSIIHQEQLSWYRRAIVQLRAQGAHRFQISHFAQSALFTDTLGSSTDREFELYGDYSCNLLNSPALHTAASLGMAGVQFSIESDRDTLNAALAHYAATSNTSGHNSGVKLRVGLLLHGRPPLFTARLDAPHFQGHRTLVSSRNERFYLDRRPDALYVRSHTVFSLLPYLSDLSRAGLDYYVLDLSQGGLKRECAEVVALLNGRGDLPAVFSGNYGGILA